MVVEERLLLIVVVILPVFLLQGTLHRKNIEVFYMHVEFGILVWALGAKEMGLNMLELKLTAAGLVPAYAHFSYQWGPGEPNPTAATNSHPEHHCLDIPATNIQFINDPFRF